MSDKDDQTSELADADFEEPPVEEKSESEAEPGAGPEPDPEPSPEPDPEPDPEPGPEATPVVKPKKRGMAGAIAGLALLVSLVAVAGVVYLYSQSLRAANTEAAGGAAVAALGEQVESTEASIASLSNALGALESANADASDSLDALRRDLDDRAALFDSVPPRMTSLERTVASLQGVSVDARNTYLVAEAEYYMQIANSQLQLAGNPYLAKLALEQADDRLLQLGDPALTDVRRTLADEVAALEVMEKPDIAGVSLTLASLAQVVESLPIRSAAASAASKYEAGDEELGGPGRAWASVKDAMSGLVKHTPPGDEQAPLLTPDAEPLIRGNLSLQLQAARLALLRGEQQIFEQSIDDADTWISVYFDTKNGAVSGMRETLAEIREGYAAVATPDISGSLRLLRQYMTLAESQQ